MLRRWLARKQQESRHGRAELRLAERAELWNAKPENRHLPSLWEWLTIRLHISASKWTPSQRKMMNKASAVHGIRTTLATLLLLVVVLSGVGIRGEVINRQKTAEASRLVEGLLKAEASQVPSVLQALEPYRNWADPELREVFDEAPEDSVTKLHAGMALVSREESAADFLSQRLMTTTPTQFAYVRELLLSRASGLAPQYWEISVDSKESARRRFHAACALASFAPKDLRWNDAELNQFVANHLVNVLPSELSPWRDALRPVAHRLYDALSAIYRNESQSSLVRKSATDILIDYQADDPNALFDLLVDATLEQFPPVCDKLGAHRGRAIELAHVEIAQLPAANSSEDEKETLAHRQANAAVLLLRLQHAECPSGSFGFFPIQRKATVVQQDMHKLKTERLTRPSRGAAQLVARTKW